MAETSFDVVVVGGGPGGYVAAIRCAQLGMKVALVERDRLGGICLNWGCIPTKALLQSAELIDRIRSAQTFGVNVADFSIDLDTVVARSRSISERLNGGVGHLMKKNRVTVVQGSAQFSSTQTLAVSEHSKTQQLSFKAAIVATGARPRRLVNLSAKPDLVWTYKEALIPRAVPRRLLIVGSGPIGMEFASIYSRLGSEVHVVEAQAQVLPHEDHEVSQLVQNSMTKQGIRFYTSAAVALKKDGDKEVTIEISTDNMTSELEFDRIITAIGVTPNSEGLNLETIGVAVDERGFITTSTRCQTNIPTIYAIGDVAGAPCLAHKASHEGIVAAEAIHGRTDVAKPIPASIPGCTYTNPQVASFGLTEQQAREREVACRIGRFHFAANGKALAMGHAEGFVKTIFDQETGELLGAHLVGPEVTEMIQGFSVAKTLEATEEELLETVFAHPTLSEAMHESVLDAFGRAIHH